MTKYSNEIELENEYIFILTFVFVRQMSSSDSPLNENSMDALDQIIITGLALIGGILR